MALEKERLQKKYDKALNALQSLQKAITITNKVDEFAKCTNLDPEEIYKTFRDSLIQRFEYTFDVTWKYLSEYLQFSGRTLAIKTPKSIFRECLKANILSANDVRLAIEMVDQRNLTTHGYDEPLIEEISKNIPNYFTLLEHIVLRTKIAN